MKPRKIPFRHCLGCGENKSKQELIRIVKSPEGEISLDETGKKPGRGAYICSDRRCLLEARASHGLERSFKMKIDAAIYDALLDGFPEKD